MIEFIPLPYYYDVYIYFCMFLVIGVLLHAYKVELNDPLNITFLRTSGWVLLILITLYIGLRPVSRKYFGDMGPYSTYFISYMNGGEINTDRDVLFHYYMKGLSYVVSIHTFFFITALLYVIPTFLISRAHFKKHWFYAFLMFVVSFSFYTYGTNGMRNGLATSMFLWGLCYPNKKILVAFFFIVACCLHQTLLLPIGAYIVTSFYNEPKKYLVGWLLAIPISLFVGGVFINLFTILGFGDDRMAAYLSGEDVDTRFRWDFLFYSTFPVFAGCYFIFKRKFDDKFYYKIFNTYLICNAFWILVIRAHFSNRFAYLSWFLMAFVIIYPLLKNKFFENQMLVIAKVVTGYFMFTYLMYIIYYALIKVE